MKRLPTLASTVLTTCLTAIGSAHAQPAPCDSANTEVYAAALRLFKAPPLQTRWVDERLLHRDSARTPVAVFEKDSSLVLSVLTQLDDRFLVLGLRSKAPTSSGGILRLGRIECESPDIAYVRLLYSNVFSGRVQEPFDIEVEVLRKAGAWIATKQ